MASKLTNRKIQRHCGPHKEVRHDGPRMPSPEGSADTHTHTHTKKTAVAELAASAQTASKLPLYKNRLAEDKNPDIKQRPYKAKGLLVL